MKEVHNIKEFNRLMGGNGEQVLFFHKTCCMPCNKVEPILKNIEANLAPIRPAARFLKVDVEEIPALQRPFRVESGPRVIIMRDCVQVGKIIIGSKPKEEFITFFSDALGVPAKMLEGEVETEREQDEKDDVEEDEEDEAENEEYEGDFDENEESNAMNETQVFKQNK